LFAAVCLSTATLGGRNGVSSLAAKSLLLVADELFDLLVFSVRLGAECFGHDVYANVLAFKEVELNAGRCDVLRTKYREASTRLILSDIQARGFSAIALAAKLSVVDAGRP
jgi:hypothetical protein